MMFSEIAGYALEDCIYEGANTVLYRAIRLSDRRPVVLKCCQSPHQFTRLKQEYQVTAQLELHHSVNSYELEQQDDRLILVLEDFGGISLKQQSTERSLIQCLSIAVQLAEALIELHEHRIIHKDIKPSNILINPQTGEVKLADFSIASCLSQEKTSLMSLNQLEGTLAYLSPEQTGRMNRALDYRTDFYSLGVTLYELFTGQLPFQGQDALELVACHLSKEPPPIQQLKPEIPTAIAQIIMKLMAKNAEDRYQSAAGLRADLQHCLEELKTTGTIQNFEVGKADRIAQLNIPEKLYGREAQIKTLLTAFERARQGSKELVVVSGYSGIGKTSLIHELFKPVTASKGYFIAGKFDQFKRDIPFSCLAEAYQNFIQQVLASSPEKIEYWRDRLQSAVGQFGQLVIDVIPELELLLGKQPALPELSAIEAQNRFSQTISAFMMATASPEHPIALFLDDMQWADSMSIASLRSLMQSNENRHRLIVIAYRDNEVDAAHPLIQTLAQMEADNCAISTIELQSLSLHDVIQFVADALCCHFSKVQPLAKLLYDKTQGNPFFLSQLLKSLHANELLSFDFETNHWKWNIEQIRQQNISDNVVELMISKLKELDSGTQTILQLAACIGNLFDLQTLSIIYQKTALETIQALWEAIQQGLIVPLDQNYRAFLEVAATSEGKTSKLKFLHDRVQQAAYEMTSEDQKQEIHLTIARLLSKNTPETELEANVFELVNHWNSAIDKVVVSSEKWQLAQLNWIAGRKAKSSAAYVYSLNYFNAALRCLPDDSWNIDYSFTLTLHQSAAQAAYLTGQFEQLEELCRVILDNASNSLDRIQAYELQIQSSIAQNRMVEAVEQAIAVLESLGITLDTESSSSISLSAAEIEALANLPTMTEPQWLAAMRILASVEAAVYYSTPVLHPPLVQAAVNLSMQYGNSAESVFFYAVYGQVLCSNPMTVPVGLQFGQLASKLLNNVTTKELKARALVNIEGFINHWGTALKHSVSQLLAIYHLGVESGDLEFAALALHCQCLHAYFAGYELEKLQAEMASRYEVIAGLHQEAILSFHNIWTVGASTLISQPEDVYQLLQEQLNPLESNSGEFANHLLNQLMLAYLFGEFEVAIAASTHLRQYLNSFAGMYCVAVYNFYDSLTYLALDTKSGLDKIMINQETMKTWVQYAPMNFQHKYNLVEAERLRVLEQNYEAMEFYDRAIAGAIENGYIQEAALANERAAKFYFNLNKSKIAQAYLAEAYQQYQQWGAIAKVKQLEEQYPHLVNHSTASTIQRNVTITSSKHQSTSTSAELLDLATIFKATEAISSELVLDKLLDRLLHIILENAGAQKGCIVLDRQGELYIEAADTNQNGSEVIVESIALEQSKTVPLSVLQYVARTQKPVVLSNATVDKLCSVDPYILEYQPKSLLCAPILSQGQLIGLIYLENNLVKAAFTSDRLEIVKLLMGQAAIAIENAKLYALEQERIHQIQQKTQALEEALLQLQQSQAQVVQAEKMSALGNLVAGVAHEINNPIGFLNGSIKNAKDYVQGLLEHLSLYQQYHPNPAESVQDHAEEIDLEFICADLPQLLSSMRGATERIKEISTSLRNFSRADTEHTIPADIHIGIDSTILILKYRLKANSNRPEIGIIKQYDLFPEIHCFPGQLNQVFMNILANAIDMFDEVAEQFSYAELEAHPQTIKIQTALKDNAVEIRISDNGKGMPEEVKARIFDHLFTTKPVGKGTGLGLAIARQIIEEKHGGTLAVESIVGEGTAFVIRLPQ